MSESDTSGQLQNYSVDQAAGAIVLVLGAVASLLLVIWQSKCHCKMNLCYIFQCERRPPSEEEMEGLKDQAAKLKGDKKPAGGTLGDEQLIPSSTITKPSSKPDEEDPYLSVEETEPEPEPAAVK